MQISVALDRFVNFVLRASFSQNVVCPDSRETLEVPSIGMFSPSCFFSNSDLAQYLLLIWLKIAPFEQAARENV